MKKQKTADKATEQIRLYPREYGILRRLAFRKKISIATIIRQLITGL
jgi:hypothetical protein